ncbi:N12 class adenine-specific DNA methylase [Lachnospiraceae bacterium PM6-15]|uniref:helicase-related protein n=1 Tax=Ohessyouella blattaphilus TaxID=2949333 RepID=UPI003E1AE561
MARKYELITELYNRSLKKITSSQEEWCRFLKAAGNNYRCPFDEQVLIYAQRPNAMAVLEIEKWNKVFGRRVNRGATGITVFDKEHSERSRLKHYFDIADTHPGQFPRRVPLWQMEESHENAVIEALENSFGGEEDSQSIVSAIMGAAVNVVDDNTQDYLQELGYCIEGSFLEGLDEDNLKFAFRQALESSITYMILARSVGDIAGDYIEELDFSAIHNFNTLETVNALGVATSDMAEMVLNEISRTVRSIEKQKEDEIRTIAINKENEYSVIKKDLGQNKNQNKNQTERSVEHESNIQQTRRLQPTQPITSTGIGTSPWEIRIDEKDIPEKESEDFIHQSPDQREVEQLFARDSSDSGIEDRADSIRASNSGERDRGTKENRSNEMGGTDEQLPSLSGGDSTTGTDLQLDSDVKQAGGQELPAFLNEEYIDAIVSNKKDDLKYKKEQIELFFSIHPGQRERAEYLKLAYQDCYTEILVDGNRIGYKPEADGIHMWEGAFLSRTKESLFSWGIIAELVGKQIEKKEYYINTDIKDLKDISSQQLSLFEFNTFDKETEGGSGQLSFFRGFEISQQVIDEALCLGSNGQKSRERICAHFMKDYPIEQNASFLQQEYGRDGKGFFSGSELYSVWFDKEGLQIARGRTVDSKEKTILTWADVAKRVRELLDMGRYAPQSVLDRALDNEREGVAQSLLYLLQDFSDEARERNLMPTIREIYKTGGFPENTKDVKELLMNDEQLSNVITELTGFLEEYRENPNLLRFRLYGNDKTLNQLRGLPYSQLTFTASPEFAYEPKQFITNDEIDRLLTGGSHIQHSKFRIYSYFLEKHTTAERIAFLKNDYGWGGHGNGDSQEMHDGKGISYVRNDRFSTCDQVLLKWNQVEKRITELMKENRYMSAEELAYIPTYEKGELGRAIYVFFSNVPQEQPRPYPYGFDYSGSVPMIVEQLDNPERVDEIYQMMLPVWEGTAKDDQRYESRRKALDNMIAYREGTFSLFGEKKVPKPPVVIDTPEMPEEPPTEKEVLPTELEEPPTEKEEPNFRALATRLANFAKGNDPYGYRDAMEVGETDDDMIERLTEQIKDISQIPIVIDELKEYQYDMEPEEEAAIELDLLMEDLEALMYQIADVGMPGSKEVATEEPSRHEIVSDLIGDAGWIASDELITDGINRYFVNGNEGSDKDIADFIVKNYLTEELEPEPEAQLPADKQQPEKQQLTPPKPQRKGIYFTDIYADIPRSERHNYHITNTELGHGSSLEKYQANVMAIRLLNQLDSEERLATPEEQEVLSRYVGWGGLYKCFEETHVKYQELKSLLPEEEYTAARASTLTAFYTSPVIIEGMYKALGQMGFQKGNILEPACGVGNFMGMLPNEMRESKTYGVEIDKVSGRIARHLYQKNSIAVSGYEDVSIPDSFFDIAVGNVPFGDFKVLDRRYDKNKWLIHDYFFGKTLDKVRPGGIIAFITSKGTLDKENPSVRCYLSQRADLVGAIRLPNNAFKANAGTEVTSDIIFLQKRDRMTDIEPDWVYLAKDENDISMNSYFVNHPDMILGEMTMVTTQFGLDSTCKPYEGAELSEQLAEAITNLHAEISDYELDELGEDEDLSIEADPEVRNFSFTIAEGKLYFRENSRMHPVDMSVTAENRIRGMIELRECVRTLIWQQTEDFPDEAITSEQEKLNHLYDVYTKKYGLLCSRGNSLAFGEDSSYCLLCSLEILDEHGNLERKADMFTKRTIKPHVPVTSVDTASEALAVSISEKARVDMEYMSELSGKTFEELEAELKGVIFRDIICPMNVKDISEAYLDKERYSLVPADEYLSGNVRKKLIMAKALQEALPPEDKHTLEGTIKSLEAVQPEELTASEIGVRIGANWIPPDVYQQFMFELFGTGNNARHRMNILYSKYNGEWNISNKNTDYVNIKASTTYGTKRINAYHIFEQTLNLKDVRIFDKVLEDGNEKRVLNKKETAIAQDRQELIKSKFTEWLWKDIDRREMLCKIYNETFNSIRPREYDGQHITFNGMNPEIQFREHQINAIARGLYGGNTLLAHCVGAGKTFEMVAIAMESKRLGLCSKSLIVVPNHITEQWAAEWLQLYPAANILVATKKDFETKNRKRFCARIATGEFDAVIIGHSQFEKLPMSKERQEIILERQIEELVMGIDEAKRSGAERYTIKQMEKTRRAIENKLKKLNDQTRKDNVVNFEELGVDRIFIDESHFFKNLFLVTKMRNVGGIAQTEAQKSSDLFMKCQYLNEITNNRGVVFATGTPISNSMVELYTIQRYLQYSTLQEAEMQHFDSWAANFGETITAIELSPEGTGYRAKTRFAKFYNLPELMAMFKEVADIQTADMLNLPVPKANYHTEVIKPSELQKEMVAGLAERAEDIRTGNVDPTVDNMLRITSDGRKLALDMRLINPLAMDDENGKVALCANNIYEIWEMSKEKQAAQLAFCDLSTPKKDGSFNVYDDLKEKLIKRGIPEEEIAFIHNANTEVRKKELFSKVRSGQVRVLMGSTQKMGAGTNVQDKLIALHDLDCPWRPSDLEQRLGRIVRQGNSNEEVDIFRYVTEGTFDSYLYQLVENKQKFIAQIMTSKTPLRAAEDVDESALNYAEIKALATGNPLIIEKCNLDMELGKLNMLKANHLSQRYALEEMVVRKYPESITRLNERVDGYEKDIALVAANPKVEEGFTPMEVSGNTYYDKEEAGKAILDACTKMTGSDAVLLGQYRGFSMVLAYDSINNKYRLTVKGALSHTIDLGTDVHGNITRIDNLFENMPDRCETVKEELADTKVQLENARTEMEAPFSKEAELEDKTKRLKELNILLNMGEKDRSAVDTAPEETDNSRAKAPQEYER